MQLTFGVSETWDWEKQGGVATFRFERPPLPVLGGPTCKAKQQGANLRVSFVASPTQFASVCCLNWVRKRMCSCIQVVNCALLGGMVASLAKQGAKLGDCIAATTMHW